LSRPNIDRLIYVEITKKNFITTDWWFVQGSWPAANREIYFKMQSNESTAN